MNLNYDVLIVDDVSDNIKIIMNILKEENYNLSFAKSGKKALEILSTTNFDLILLDIMMPDIDGYEVCEIIKKDDRLADIPIIFLTAKTDMDSMTKAFEVGGVDYITKPFHSNELLSRVKTHLELYKSRLILKHNNISLEIKKEKEKKRILSELEENQKDMIYILTELIESVSDETGKHIKRVAEYSKLLASYHELINDEDANIIFHASPMHDIGKLLIPKKILNKNSSLTDEEYEIIKTHPSLAHKYLKIANRKTMKAADIIAHEHHEKWDGTGYPRGLKGKEIHLFGRIVCLADVFDALTHKRVYKEAWSIDEAVSFILDNSGTHFDPYLVKLFEEHVDEFISISKL